jgi:hypothetical protein
LITVINILIKQKNKTTWTIKATGMLKVCSILRIVTDVNFEKSSNHRIWIQLRHFLVSGILNIRLLLPFGNGSGILLSMSDKETQSSSGGFGHL